MKTATKTGSEHVRRKGAKKKKGGGATELGMAPVERWQNTRKWAGASLKTLLFKGGGKMLAKRRGKTGEGDKSE